MSRTSGTKNAQVTIELLIESTEEAFQMAKGYDDFRRMGDLKIRKTALVESLTAVKRFSGDKEGK